MSWGNWNPPGSSRPRSRSSSSTSRAAPRQWSGARQWSAATHSNPAVRRAVAGGDYGAVSRNYISGGRTTGPLSGNEREAWSYWTTPAEQGGQGIGLNTGRFDPEGWSNFRSQNIDAQGNFLSAPGGAPLDLGGGGGGGGGYGGGGGGGGGPAITQAMIDAMGRVLGAQGPQLNLPAFQGQALGAFNAQPYTQARQQVGTAQAADLANITANQAATTQALNQAYTNDYANAQVTPGVQQQQQGVALADTAGQGGGNAAAQATQQANTDNADSQASFQNLLKVLGAASQQSQASRQAQVGMDANYGRQGVNAAASGMNAGIANKQAQASTAWGQQQQERNYQNSLMRQQWQREQGQANWQNQNTQRTAMLQPILQLIQQSAGTSGLNFNALYRALGIAS